MANNSLNNARAAKKDEFYTQFYDIELEMEAYLDYNPDVFRGKTVLLPCDDPEWSNFTRYFAQNFEDLGLKKLISTSYAPESMTFKKGVQLSLFETLSPKYDADKTRTHGKIFVLTEDTTGDGVIDLDDLQWDYLEGDGDFRSDEVKKLRDEADIIITNPPFSLFRVFLAWIVEAKKQFIIIGNINCVTYKEVFPLIQNNSVWMGCTIHSGDREFGVPDEYPLKAVREAILNALVHRDYSIHSENVPVRLEIYRNRLEIISSGGLYGKLTIDSLGKVRPDTRNSALANILELMQVTENRYSGIPTIYHELQKAQLPPPAFCIRHGEFVVTFKSKISQVYDAPYATVSSVQEEQEQYNGQRAYSIEERLIEFCTVPRSRQEIIEFLGFSRYYSMSKIVQPLIDDGKIALTLPDKPKSSKQRYVRR